MNEYKMIALDMDGTLLNSSKEISKNTLRAIDMAFDAGKEVIFCTGRCLAELNYYIEQIPRLRYIVGLSGAFVYDIKEDMNIFTNKIPERDVKKILEASKKVDAMVHLLERESIVQKSNMENMKHFQMDRYIPLFYNVSTVVEDIYKFYFEEKPTVMKLNMYHCSAKEREKTRRALADEKLILVNAEETSLEISAEGTTKATGLIKLCEHLGISLEDVIAVGDADNDLDVLSKVGLSIAMGNANDNVKKICDAVVSDCDNDGCVEAIEKYLI